MSMPFKILKVGLDYAVMAVERNILNSEGDDVCVALLPTKEKALHLCGKLNDATIDEVTV